MQYSAQPRDISKNLSAKYNKKRLKHPKKSGIDALKASSKGVN